MTKQKKERTFFNMRIDCDLLVKFKALAKAHKRSLSNYIQSSLCRDIENKKRIEKLAQIKRNHNLN